MSVRPSFWLRPKSQISPTEILFVFYLPSYILHSTSSIKPMFTRNASLENPMITFHKFKTRFFLGKKKTKILV